MKKKKKILMFFLLLLFICIVLLVFGKMDRGGAETLVMSIYRKLDRSKIQFDFMLHSTEKGHYDDEI